MDSRDRIIADLMDALDLIKRHAETPDASRHYICGVAHGAMMQCNLQRRRNTDGYLVAEREKAVSRG